MQNFVIKFMIYPSNITAVIELRRDEKKIIHVDREILQTHLFSFSHPSRDISYLSHLTYSCVT